MTSLQGASLALTVLGKALVSAPSCGSILSLSKRPSGAFRFIRPLMRSAISFEVVDAESQGHAALAAELVDEDFVAGMAFDVFETGAPGRRERTSLFPWQPLPVRADFADAVGDLGDFELGRNFFADALEFAVLFEGFDPVAQIVVGQGFAPMRQMPQSTL